MTALLASVRDLDEAELACAGGCGWLDFKEPAQGALGAVPLVVAAAAVYRHAGHLPLSATIGDCWETPAEIPPRVRALAALGMPYIKVGLFAGTLSDALSTALRAAAAETHGLIAVCFAEDPPGPAQIAELARLGCRGIMLDTADKQRGTLCDLLPLPRLAAFLREARAQSLLTGLAGSLRAQHVAPLLDLAPDYLGFRGALCGGHARSAALDPDAVRAVRALFRPSLPARARVRFPYGGAIDGLA
jgi:uncharacterized protein (UPF0264 family)